MNIILLSPQEAGKALLPPRDTRAAHIRRILRKSVGDTVLVGVEGASLHEARILSDEEAGMALELGPGRRAPPLLPLCLILGFPRPIQAKRILKDLCSLGVSRIILAGTDLGEKSYREGSFFSDGGWEGAIREGASQAGSPLLPMVSTQTSLDAAIAELGSAAGTRVALDAEGSHRGLGSVSFDARNGAVLAVGSERGWTERERALLSATGFASASLGKRILRTETACVAAVSIVLSRMGVME